MCVYEMSLFAKTDSSVIYIKKIMFFIVIMFEIEIEFNWNGQ